MRGRNTRRNAVEMDRVLELFGISAGLALGVPAACSN